VFYELGIAHTLAKPVLIISGNENDIPTDLSTRRVIMYDRDGDTWASTLECKAGRAIGEVLEKYGLAPAAAQPAVPSAAAAPAATIGQSNHEGEVEVV
jgi:hypothetical protein